MTCNMQNKHSSILFFKIITTTFLEAGKLRIPNNFTQRYGGEMSNPMFLKPPDGTEWKIYHSKTDGDVWFQNGWKEFAEYYSLDHGHMVLFEYKGASHFGVHIFDKSTLQIEYPSHGNQDKQDNLVKIEYDSVEILDEIPPCKKTKLKSPMSCPKPLKKLRTSTTEDVGRSSKLQKLPKKVQIEGNHSQGTNFEKSAYEPVNNELDVSDDAGGTTECLKGEQSTSKITSTDALNRARTFRSKNPSFRAVIKPDYVYQCLNVPSSFLRKYFKSKEQNIMLQFEKKFWPVKLLYHPHNGSGKLSKGWALFGRTSKLAGGDVCVFELIKKEDPVFDVHIFKEYPSHGNQDKQDNHVKIDDDSVEIMDEIPPCKKTKLKSPMSCPKPLKKLRTSTSEDVGRSCKLQNLPKKVQIEDDAGGTAECLKGEQLTAKITSADALDRARTFRSDNPSFRAVIKHALDCQYLNVPNFFIRKYFTCKEQTLMLQFEKELLPVKLICYPHNGKMFRSGKLSKGWPLFARESNLVVGDVCVFELINKEDLVLQVHIYKGH